jgi:DUF218 domain
VIERVLWTLKWIDAPGSTPFFWICVAVGALVTFVWPHNRRWGKRWFAGLGALYVTLALPVVANVLASGLGSHTDGVGRPGDPLDMLVVFDGDNRTGRVRATVQAFQQSAPPEIWVLGLEADWFQRELPAAGVPSRRIHVDSSTGTTRAQVEWVARRRTERPTSRMAVIVSRLQVPRVLAIARMIGLSGVPVIGAEVNHEPPTAGWQRWVPNYFTLHVSRDALYEHAALAYYAERGWIER